VFGEGKRTAKVVFVGEQPGDQGDQEDKLGHPFVGPAGRILDEALAEAGIDLAEDSIAVGSASIDGGNEAFDRLWDAGRRPTAVLAMSDAMAIGAIRAIHQRGLSVPGEISVVGFDDVDLAASTDPPLTTVHQPVKGKGDAAVRLLLSVMEGGHSAPVHRRLETRLVIRSSTGPASQAGREVTAGRPKSA
jgi:DNA-binding LacI/PurR family transcriptional regulator